MPHHPTRLGALVLLAALATACGGEPDAAPTSAVDGDYPLTVDNCGVEVTIEQAPERTVLLTSSPVPFLSALGVMDRVVSRAGAYPTDYYDETTQAEIDGIPLLTDKLDTSGHLQISKEVVISQEPDLVLGEADNLSRDALDAVDIPQLLEPALCPEGVDEPGFDDVYAQMELYGRVYGREEQAAAAVADLQERTAAAQAEADVAAGRTAAVLYPTVGGGVTYAYGTRSMAQPQLEAAGFENVFGDVDERVFEVTLEELLGRDPDVLILLHVDGDPSDVEAAITELPGADKLTAVTEDAVMTQLFNFTEPPTPLSIDGLERIVARFGAGS